MVNPKRSPLTQKLLALIESLDDTQLGIMWSQVDERDFANRYPSGCKIMLVVQTPVPSDPLDPARITRMSKVDNMINNIKTQFGARK